MRAIIHTTFAGVLLALLTTLPVPAGPPLTITDSGYWITVVDDGVPTLVPMGPVIDMRTDGDQPVPPETDSDTPVATPPMEGISADAAQWATEVGNPAEAQRYTLIFETVRDGVKNGDIDIIDILDVLKQSANDLVGPEWQSFRKRVGDYLVGQLQFGNMKTRKQAAAQLELIRYGIGYSARNSENTLTDADAVEVVAKVNSIVDSLGE